LLLLCAAVSSFGQTSGDWPMYGHDGESSRFSPLTQINVSNVAQLKRAWTFHMKPAGETQAAPTNALRARLQQRRSEATPLMVNGVLYLPSPYNRVIALDATSGKQIWEYKIDKDDNASTRGVAYWPGDGKLGPRIVFGTAGGSLIALDAKTGKAISTFGKDGVVDLHVGVTDDFPDGRFGLSSPPAIYKNVVITGARVQESPTRGPSGDTRGWDVVTGKLLWQFHSVPHPGEQGIETWETPDSWKNRSGTNVWGLITVDPATGSVFLPYGASTTDAYGGDRKGANLYSDTLVVLDALTGKQRWHFQLIHHDTWDWDLESAPILVTVHRDKESIPAVVVTNKSGLVFILDRRDGTPIYGVEERKIPASDVPGEDNDITTEPWPVKPAPLSRMSFTMDEISNVTPEHHQACEDLFTKYPGTHNDGPFTRYGLKPSIVFPGTWGGMDWQGGSYDPQLNYVFFNVNDYADYGVMVPTAPGSDIPYQRKGPIGGNYDRFADSKTGWPCQQPPWGELVALNLDTGEYAWREPFGTIPELDAKGVHNTGSLNMGGSIATAGGLVFIAATPDQNFRAFEAKTGKVLWETKLEAAGGDTPMTYRGKNGKQYVVIVVTGATFSQSNSDVVAAYALP
jgi:quinoprotein glucose dehydrogenase